MKHIPNYTPPTRDVPKLSSFNDFNKDDVSEIMSKLGSKQCEQDTLLISIIWQCEPIVQEHLLTIINSSLKSGHFPQTWKQALVKPIIKNPKIGTPDKNYRPVSNLKYFSKILECVALQQIVDHCEHNNLLPRNQSAYRKGYSCETMLVKLVDCILNGMECQEISAVVACDLSATFDTVNISVLLSTFHNYYGITGDVLKWVESYLTDQSCSVMINGKKSSPKHLTLSVPQGSCSGAYFFIMYAATLFESVQEVDLFGFADDHILINTFKAGDRQSEMNSIINLENALIDTKTWMDGVKLKMNPDKTEFIYFGFRTQMSKCLIKSIEVVGNEIERSGVVRYLGGFLDTHLSLRSHVTKKCAIASGNIAKIRSIHRFLTQDTCAIVIHGLVTSHMDYANGILLNVQDITIKPYQ